MISLPISNRCKRRPALTPRVVCAAALGTLLAATATATPDPTLNPQVVADWRVYTAADGLPAAPVRVLCVSGDQVWVGAGGALARFDGIAWRSWTVSDGLPARTISAIAVDAATGDVWVGTLGDGLVRFSGGRFDRFDQMNSGLAGNLVYAAAFFEGRVWAATNGGVSVFDPRAEQWTLHDARQANGGAPPTSGFAAFGARLAAGTWGGGLLRNDGDAWVALKDAPEFKCRPDAGCGESHTVVALAAADGALWAITSSHVCRWDKHARCAAKALPAIEPQPFMATALAVSEKGEAWIGTDDGLLVSSDWESDTWLRYRRDSDGSTRVTILRGGTEIDSRLLGVAILDNRIRAVALRGDSVWVGTAAGVAVTERWVAWSQLAEHSKDSRNAAVSGEKGATIGASPPGAPPERVAVAIAVLGPGNRTMALPAAPAGAGDIGTSVPTADHPDLLAVQLAVELARGAKARRGETAVSLALTAPGYAGYGWGLPEDNLVGLAERSNVLGVVGSLGAVGAAADLAVLRLEVPVVDVFGDRDRDASQRNPWVFRCRGGAPRQHRLLLDHAVDGLGLTRLAILRTGDSCGGPGDWWVDHARARGLPAVFEARVPREGVAVEQLLERLRQAGAQAVFLDGEALAVAAMIGRLRRAGCDQPVVVDSPLCGIDLTEHLGAEPGVVLAATASPPGTSPADLAFVDKYAERNRRDGTPMPPGENAFRTLYATDHLLHAVSAAPADRTAVRRALWRMEHSAYGERHYEETHPVAEVKVLRWEGGRWQEYVISAR